jgi:hypothetical protein
MIRHLFGEAFRVDTTSAWSPSVTVVLALVLGLAAVSCGSSNQDHTHSGEQISSGKVSEARIDGLKTPPYQF